MSFGFLLTAVLYYIFMYAQFFFLQRKKSPEDRQSYFTIATSQYFETYIEETE
jgi:hypothetical protein